MPRLIPLRLPYDFDSCREVFVSVTELNSSTFNVTRQLALSTSPCSMRLTSDGRNPALAAASLSVSSFDLRHALISAPRSIHWSITAGITFLPWHRKQGNIPQYGPLNPSLYLMPDANVSPVPSHCKHVTSSMLTLFTQLREW
jgi:hypothetical protein